MVAPLLSSSEESSSPNTRPQLAIAMMPLSAYVIKYIETMVAACGCGGGTFLVPRMKIGHASRSAFIPTQCCTARILFQMYVKLVQKTCLGFPQMETGSAKIANGKAAIQRTVSLNPQLLRQNHLLRPRQQPAPSLLIASMDLRSARAPRATRPAAATAAPTPWIATASRARFAPMGAVPPKTRSTPNVIKMTRIVFMPERARTQRFPLWRPRALGHCPASWRDAMGTLEI